MCDITIFGLNQLSISGLSNGGSFRHFYRIFVLWLFPIVLTRKCGISNSMFDNFPNFEENGFENHFPDFYVECIHYNLFVFYFKIRPYFSRKRIFRISYFSTSTTLCDKQEYTYIL